MKKYILLKLVLLLVLSGCKSLEVIKAEKQKVVSGMPSGVPEIKFSFELKAKKTFRIDSIIIKSELDSKKYLVFELYNLPEGKILNSKQFLNKGRYYIKIASSVKDENVKDYIFIYYLENGIKQKLKAEIQEKESLLMKLNY